MRLSTYMLYRLKNGLLIEINRYDYFSDKEYYQALKSIYDKDQATDGECKIQDTESFKNIISLI
jgi:hypothetical protein